MNTQTPKRGSPAWFAQRRADLHAKPKLTPLEQELLAALKRLLEHPNMGLWSEMAVQMAREAIAKAEGLSS